jgi:plasmid stabilization system protein ParE
MKIRHHVAAREDIAGILEYYEVEAGHGVAVEFFSELRRCMRRIARDPHSFLEIRRGIRRCLLTQFPYQINFEVLPDRIVRILVVKHQRRHPDFGMDRT